MTCARCGDSKEVHVRADGSSVRKPCARFLQNWDDAPAAESPSAESTPDAEPAAPVAAGE